MTEYTLIERSLAIAVPPSEIVPLLVDFRRWLDWSPWEGLDPELNRIYTGPDSGIGASYEWSGNRKAGAGRMEVVGVTDASVDVDLRFTKPFKSTMLVHFDLPASPTGTAAVWQMRSPKTTMSRVMGVFMNVEKLVGPDLEQGLANLKRVLETPSAPAV